MRFAIREGGRTVGAGRVTDIVAHNKLHQRSRVALAAGILCWLGKVEHNG